MDDMELMQEWVDHGSEDAFRSIVDRHVNLVYSTARRLVSNPHEAEEVTQTVFILLARKARSLSKETVMPAGCIGPHVLRRPKCSGQKVGDINASKTCRKWTLRSPIRFGSRSPRCWKKP